MPQAARLGDICTGHECWPSRASISGSPDVFINGMAAHRVGDSWETHCCTHPEMPHGCHDSVLAAGSSTVYVNHIPLGRIGDPIECGSSVASGSPNVFAGG